MFEINGKSYAEFVIDPEVLPPTCETCIFFDGVRCAKEVWFMYGRDMRTLNISGCNRYEERKE